MEGKILSREDSKKITEVIKVIERRHEATDFLKPVDYKGLGLDDYPHIIKHPMDISTIKKKLKGSKYSCIAEAMADLLLIWDNCRTYNQVGSDIVKQADILEALMRKQCETSNIPLDLPQKRPREEPKPEHIPEIVTLNAKLDFADKIKKVGHEILFDIVKNIESDCKQALEELDPDRIQIKVDSLDKQTFDKLMNLVDSAIDESRPHKYSNNKSNKKF